MYKTLVFLRENTIGPKGGPAGYVYNLRGGLKSNNNELYFLPSEKHAQEYKNVYRSLPNFVKKIWRFRSHRKEIKYLECRSQGVTLDYLNQFDCIHFHSCVALYKNLALLKDYKGEVVLTSHSPEAPQFDADTCKSNPNFVVFDRKIVLLF